jgi:NAD(P)-dependent dehydrogenase (short-subunit alcohol dehydrogenase family)
LDLRGRVAVVTGASGGIGAAAVRALARAGTHLVLAAPKSESERLAALAAEVEAQGVRALVVPTDVTVRADVDALVAAAVEGFETVDVLANVAGVGSSPSLCDQTRDEIDRVVAVNLLGCAHTMHAVLPVMKLRRSGSIVNIGSVAGEAGVMGVYSASKFGLRGLTDSVRREVRSFGIGVTLIEPGFVRTPMNAAMGDGLPGPEIVAEAIVRAAQRPRRRVIVPWYYGIPVFIANAFPGLVDAVFGDARIQERLNRDARAERARSNALQREIL